MLVEMRSNYPTPLINSVPNEITWDCFEGKVCIPAYLIIQHWPKDLLSDALNLIATLQLHILLLRTISQAYSRDTATIATAVVRSVIRHQHETISATLNWFYDVALGDISDADIISRIPDYIEPGIRSLVASHVPIVRAVYQYRDDRNAPIEQTKMFRFNLINRYDIGKTGGETFCKMKQNYGMLRLLLFDFVT
jgi:hypothetical protein